MLYEITEEQLMDYMTCPIHYALKYNGGRMRVDKPVTLSRLVNQVVNGFCLNLMDGKIMRPDILKRKWDMLCKKYPDYLNSQKIREGMGHLFRFYSWAEEEELRVASIGEPYTISIHLNDTDMIQYHGSLGIIIVNKNDQPENFKLSCSTRLPDQANLDLSLKTTLDHVGFYRLYKQPLAGTKIHHSRKNRDFYTTRDLPLATKRVESVIKNVTLAIKNNIWYPHEGPMCESCNLRDFCMMYG